jgi:hypothetical protein
MVGSAARSSAASNDLAPNFANDAAANAAPDVSKNRRREKGVWAMPSPELSFVTCHLSLVSPIPNPLASDK